MELSNRSDCDLAATLCTEASLNSWQVNILCIVLLIPIFVVVLHVVPQSQLLAKTNKKRKNYYILNLLVIDSLSTSVAQRIRRERENDWEEGEEEKCFEASNDKYVYIVIWSDI